MAARALCLSPPPRSAPSQPETPNLSPGIAALAAPTAIAPTVPTPALTPQAELTKEFRHRDTASAVHVTPVPCAVMLPNWSDEDLAKNLKPDDVCGWVAVNVGDPFAAAPLPWSGVCGTLDEEMRTGAHLESGRTSCTAPCPPSASRRSTRWRAPSRGS